ncbi:hypothetical protein Tco_1006140 [Tanacetum coccineum]|uniref:Uncharacterized protein n=1 Tax=Tanacetum coccineum TaxID=301880 RepID=A0ABQ5FIS7_9ASTR
MFSLVWIMPPRVMTRSAGRPAAESLGGGTGERVGRGGRGRRPREGNDEHVDELNEALDKRHIRENFNISSSEIVYKFVPRDPLSRSTPSKSRTKHECL